MALLKETLDYVRKYGLGRLLKKVPGRIYRTFKPAFQFAGIIKNTAMTVSHDFYFNVHGQSPRINVVLCRQDIDVGKADQTVCLAVSLAARVEYGLRIISEPTFNSIRFSRLLKSRDLQTGNVEFSSFATGRVNSEIDIVAPDMFIACSWQAVDRIASYINAKNIVYCIFEDELKSCPDESTRSACLAIMNNPEIHRVVQNRQLFERLGDKGCASLPGNLICLEDEQGQELLQQIIRDRSNTQSGGYHVHP